MIEPHDSLTRDAPAALPADLPSIQPHGFLLELSLDWLVLRASENVHRFLGESHVTLIGEPLGNFIQADPLHDLRNLFSKLSGTTGLARAYRVRLTDGGGRFDVAFQINRGKVLLEGVPSPEQGLGEAIGSVAGLIDGLAEVRGHELREMAARRMRALTGFDRVTLECGGERVESGRAGARFAAPGDAASGPKLLAAADCAAVPMFPRKPAAAPIDCTLLCAPSATQAEQMVSQGIIASLRVAMVRAGQTVGHFKCDNAAPRACGFETYAAAELFAQMFALQLEIDRLS
ncbi:GAF domain-containing protein [Sphingomonas sp.]|uniref:GAF domain-containing protein n=1 Tax=Sphingomonas sp. TaxID=28214 RepID=UPI00286E82FD|nr:GAF domain-containing protein [Sphingomonas sp.]